VAIASLGDVILTRRLTLAGSQEPVVVQVGRPIAAADGLEYRCPYSIRGLGSDRFSFGAGVDEVQALLLALNKIGIELYVSEAYRDRKLWLEAGDPDLGFPVPKGSGLGPEVD
jgi:hypothetical protein